MIEVGRGRSRSGQESVFVGRPQGFGCSELKEFEDFNVRHRIELVAGSDSAKQGTGKWFFFGRPEEFGRSELNEIVDLDGPHLIVFVTGYHYVEHIDCFSEEGSNVDDVFWLESA